jgi:hypothetical protein
MKICCKCKQSKQVSEFNRKSSNVDGLERYCKTCHREKNKIHYDNNKQKYIDTAVSNNKKFKQWWVEFKKQFKCVRCGEDKYWRISFHHTDPSTKDFDVSHMISNRKSKQMICEEINKCIPVCHNCHSDIHHELRIAIV